MNDTFSIVVPAELSKAKDGSYKVRGLATTEKIDSQGELLIQGGIDLSPIDQNRGVLNWDHGKDPTDIVGILEGYSHTPKGMVVEGTLFKKHTKANAIREIMESLDEKDKGRMGLSVEGAIVKRNDLNPKIIEKCVISAVALTMNPVNTETHVELIKSLNASSVEFKAEGKKKSTIIEKSNQYSSDQVLELVLKAVSLGGGGLQAPSERSGGDALALEDLDAKKKKLKKAGEFLEAGLEKILKNLVILYPYVPEEDLWGAMKDRINKKFPNLSEY